MREHESSLIRNGAVARGPLRGFFATTLLIGVTTVVVVGLPICFLWGSAELARLLGEEDGVYETFGALATLAAGCLFLLTYFARPTSTDDLERRGHASRIVTLLLGLALLLMFGEEISWGQRVFNFQPPRWVEDANVQRELTIHNLRLFQPDVANNRLKLGWIWISVGFLGVLPITATIVPRVARAAYRLGVPLAPPSVSWSALVAVVLYFVFTLYSLQMNHLMAGHGAGESIETAIEFLYLALAIDVAVPKLRASPESQVRRGRWVFGVIISCVAALLIGGSILQQMRRAEAMEALDRSQLAIQQQQFEAAARAARRAAKLMPNEPEPYFYWAVALAQLGQLDHAASALAVVIRLDPSALEARRNLAAIYLEQGNATAAVALHREITKIDPSPASFTDLGVALLRARDREQAATAFEQALKLDPQHEKALRLLERLRSDAH